MLLRGKSEIHISSLPSFSDRKQAKQEESWSFLPIFVCFFYWFFGTMNCDGKPSADLECIEGRLFGGWRKRSGLTPPEKCLSSETPRT